MLTTTLLYAGFLPLVAAALAAIVVQRAGASREAAWAWGVSLGFMAAQFGLKSQAGFATAASALMHPNEAGDWLPIIMLLVLGLSLLLISASQNTRRYVVGLAVALVIAVPLRLVSGNYRLTEVWSPFEKVGYLVLLAGGLGIVWRLLALGEKQSAAPRLLCVALVAIGMAIVLSLSGALGYAQLSGAVAAALAGAALPCFFPGATGSASASGATAGLSGSPHFVFPGFPGATAPIAFSLGSLIILGHFTAELSVLNAVLLMLSLAAASGPLPRPLAEQPIWLQFAGRTLICLVPLTIAVVSVVE